MSRKILLLALLGLLTIAMAIGCSSKDDESTPTGNTIQTGDPNDPELAMVEDLFDGVGEFPQLFLMTVFEVMDSVYRAAGAPSGQRPIRFGDGLDVEADSALFEYHAASGYWYLYFSSDTLGWSQLIIDSVQFMHGTMVVQWPDSALLTRVNSGGLLFMATPFDTIDGNMSMSIVGALADFGDVEIDGGGSVTFSGGWSEGETNTCSFDLSFSHELTDIQLNLAEVFMYEGCPWAGTLEYTGSVFAGCQGDTTWSFSDQWMFKETFNDGLINVVIENSTHRWTFTDTCYAQTSPRPGARLSAFTFDR